VNHNATSGGRALGRPTGPLLTPDTARSGFLHQRDRPRALPAAGGRNSGRAAGGSADGGGEGTAGARLGGGPTDRQRHGASDSLPDPGAGSLDGSQGWVSLPLVLVAGLTLAAGRQLSGAVDGLALFASLASFPTVAFLSVPVVTLIAVTLFGRLSGSPVVGAEAAD